MEKNVEVQIKLEHSFRAKLCLGRFRLVQSPGGTLTPQIRLYPALTWTMTEGWGWRGGR